MNKLSARFFGNVPLFGTLSRCNKIIITLILKTLHPINGKSCPQKGNSHTIILYIRKKAVAL